MAEQQTALAAPFPTPPPFYKHFTKQNVSRLRQLRKEAGNNGDAAPQVNILQLPSELRYLVPPSLPAEGVYRTFGAHIDLHAPDATLESAGIEQLYPSGDSAKLNPQPHLLALTRSLLTTFLSLVGILSGNPAEYYAERVESLQTILYNIHDLINQYRPHQARESLLLIMEERIEKMRDEIQMIKRARTKAEDLLKELGRGNDANNSGERIEEEGGSSGSRADALSLVAKEGQRSRQRAAWAAIESVIGDET